jgi:HD-GYP domain-containing protein (c-di-GMP phosphodiesterase class II)
MHKRPTRWRDDPYLAKALSARTVAVADAYDPMTTDRPYRQALSPETAFGRLRSGSRTQWEGLYVGALIAAAGAGTPPSLVPG